MEDETGTEFFLRGKRQHINRGTRQNGFSPISRQGHCSEKITTQRYQTVNDTEHHVTSARALTTDIIDVQHGWYVLSPLARGSRHVGMFTIRG